MCFHVVTELGAELTEGGRAAQVIAQRTHPSAHTGRSTASALALKAATAVLHSLLDADPLPESITVPPACLFTSKARSDLWHAVARGEEPVCEVRRCLEPHSLSHQMQ